jgi:enamine deaminase RidA (YjgF/YER057c/UK114 family)
VRLDQFYPTWTAVDPYHLARRAAFGDYIPPSTSVIMQELLVRGADITSSVIAVLPGGGRDPRRVEAPKVTAPTWSGFVPAARSGDFIFVAGQMARGADNTPDARAHVPPHSLWGGYEIRRQTEYIISEKLKPALAAAGSSPGNAIKAQAYLRHVEDTAHYVDVWNAHFGERQCALTIVPTCDFGLTDGNLEINLIAVTDNGRTKKQIVDAGIASAMCFGAPAVRAGDLLLTSGLMAADDNGAIAGSVSGAHFPHFGIGAQAQMRFILDQADRLCAAVGADLGDAARIQQFHTDLGEFYPMYQTQRARYGDAAVPFSAVRVPATPIPGVSVIVDFWIYAP